MLAALIIANYHSNQIFYQYNNKQVKHNLKEEINFIVSKSATIKTKIGQRNKLSSDCGRWFLIKEQNNIMYAACVQEDYPERLAYGVIQKIRTFVKDKSIDGYNNKKISSFVKELKNICQHYKDSRVDKVKQAQVAVQDLKGELNKGIKKVFDNNQNLDRLTDRTNLMKDYAKQFEKSAVVVQKQAFWKKWRIHFMISFILASILITVGVSLYIKNHHH